MEALNKPKAYTENGEIEVIGARENNLQDVDLTIPRNKLVVFTGLSGSGKSSMAFDTIFAEGQRRYLESFSAYARQFIGDMKRPDVDKISGLSPVISIEQKTVSRNPRSTVGTVTELYDFLRLLFARAGEAFSYLSGAKMVRFTEDQLIETIANRYQNEKITILAPVVRARKGHYRELFELTRKRGYNKVRVDGEIQEISSGMQLDRYKIHDIEVVIDRVEANPLDTQRLSESIRTAMKLGEGYLMVEHKGKAQPFSKFLMDPETGLSYDEPQPNMFSFNSPYGACPECEGLGEIAEVNIDYIIPDVTKSINKGAIVPIGELRENWTFTQLRAIAKFYKFSLADAINKIPEEAMKVVLYGTEESIPVEYTDSSGKKVKYNTNYKGIIKYISENYFESDDEKMRQWAEEFMHQQVCPKCNGARLKSEPLWFRIDNKNIAELAGMNIEHLSTWLDNLEARLTERQQIIATELLKEIRARVSFLTGVGLGYLSLNSPARTLSGGEAQRIR
ncbi:MAG: excinuclease ABC subunit UvrA, partial [Bacteroidia bacterium]|nr:excinuclease ABC subunit UvrA [Bacteroidia bacterium]